jgi:predicted amino acid-binding ACT domain protein
MAVSIKASESGLAIMDIARRQRGWFKSQPEWIETASVSTSALRRFWLGQPIKRDSFIAICTTVGVDWRDVVDIDSPEDLAAIIEKMKSLFAKTVKLDPQLNEATAVMDEETINSLCYGWLFELFRLMLRATEKSNPDTSFYRLTQDLMHKISTLFESQIDADNEFLVEVTVKDKAGSLHQVTGILVEYEVNINHVHIISSGDGMAWMKIYCQLPNKQALNKPLKAKLKKQLKDYSPKKEAAVRQLSEPFGRVE